MNNYFLGILSKNFLYIICKKNFSIMEHILTFIYCFKNHMNLKIKNIQFKYRIIYYTYFFPNSYVKTLILISTK